MPTIDIFLNVTAPPFNAVGDGVTDDTAAIQNAINASVASPNYHQRVEFPRAVYVISRTLLLPTGVSIEGNGATILRKTGGTPPFVFDMLANDDPTNGNENITIKNLIIDGARQIDSLVATNNADRFAGLSFENVQNSYLENVTVNNTVNAEIQTSGKTTGGVFIYLCRNIVCRGLHGFDNDRTAIFIYDSIRIRILGSITANNWGSGITSGRADECEYHDILTYDNGNPDLAPVENYTNLSINGLRCKATNITSYRASGSGVNLGHSDGFPCDYTFLSNVHSYNNALDGVSVANSTGVSLVSIYVYGNKRDGLKLRRELYQGEWVVSNQIRISHLFSKNNGSREGGNAYGEGVYFDGGEGHVIDSSIISNNRFSGIFISETAQVTIGLGVETYNNSQDGVGVAAGVIIDKAQNCRIFGLSAFDDQVTKTQDGVWINGVGLSTVRPNQINFDWGIKNNASFNIQQANVVDLQLDNQILHDGNEFHSIAPISPWTVSSGAGYWLDRNGFVHLLGVFNNGTTGTVCFNLPVGFRPSTSMQFSTPANNAHSNTVIDTSGNITLYTSNVNHYIDGICFKAMI